VCGAFVIWERIPGPVRCIRPLLGLLCPSFQAVSCTDSTLKLSPHVRELRKKVSKAVKAKRTQENTKTLKNKRLIDLKAVIDFQGLA
jgi:hypothetical protein